MDQVRRRFLIQLGLLMAASGASTADVTAAAAQSAPSQNPAGKRTQAELVAAKLALPFSSNKKRNASNYPVLSPSQNWEAIGLSPKMASTGGRQEIGLVTDQIGDWLCGGSPNNMLVQAQAHKAVPVHFRDKEGQRYSIVKYPRASCYYDKRAVAADPWLQLPSDSPVSPDAAHYPSLSYIPYLHTGDIAHLEELQDAANYCLLVMNPGYRGYEKGWIDEDQTRGYAWTLKLIAEAYIATPENASAPLLPKEYWKTILDNNRDRFRQKWVKNGINNPLTRCHFAVDLGKDRPAPWQQDILGIVLGWMVWTGQFGDWRENYEWQIQQAIDRTSGKSGYPRSQATFYYYKTTGVSDMASLAVANGLSETPNGNYPPNHDVEYAAWLRMNLRIAELNGISGASECFAYADKQTKWVPARMAV